MYLSVVGTVGTTKHTVCPQVKTKYTTIIQVILRENAAMTPARVSPTNYRRTARIAFALPHPVAVHEISVHGNFSTSFVNFLARISALARPRRNTVRARRPNLVKTRFCFSHQRSQPPLANTTKSTEHRWALYNIVWYNMFHVRLTRLVGQYLKRGCTCMLCP